MYAYVCICMPVCQYAGGMVWPIALNENKALEMKYDEIKSKRAKSFAKSKEQSDAKSVYK